MEVVDHGKYVRAWCSRAKGGSELFIKGRTIECRSGDLEEDDINDGKTDRKNAAGASRPRGSEHFDLSWMQKNQGYLNKTEKQLESEGFKYNARFNGYKKEPFPPAVLMNCFMENGKVKHSIINLGSFSDPKTAANRYARYTASFESQLKGQKAEWKTFTTKSRTNTKTIKIYDLKDAKFMVAVYLMELPVINKSIIFTAAFSKQYYSSFDSVVNELGK